MSTTSEIRPFHIDIAESDLADLRRRLARTRWPQHPSDDDWARGVPAPYLHRLAHHWANTYDWRAQEARLNEFPQFTTNIDGQTIHFFHVRSTVPGALPLILTHGWPSSPVEFLQMIGPLTDPVSYGGDPTEAFDVVIPSLPGYGFSTPVTSPGWGNLFRVAQAWAELMRRIGYPRYAAHGTDVGSGVAGLLGLVDAEHVVGVHLTGTVPAFPFGPRIDPSGMSEDDRRRAEHFNATQIDGLGYLHLQATRPQTLAYGLTDSPVAQLAWVVEKFKEWTDPAHDLPEDAVDLDQLLTTVSIFWYTRAGASAAHAVQEGMQAYRQLVAAGAGQDADSGQERQAGPPTAYAVFAGDDAIQQLLDPTGQARWTNYDRGGHFPAMEVPRLLTEDLRRFFGQHRPTKPR